MLRSQLEQAMKQAEAVDDQRAAATLRLVMTALNERDFCAREAGTVDGLSDDAIVDMIQSMVEQRRHSITRCEETARLDFAVQEAEEIKVLEQFLPPKMGPEEVSEAVECAIRECGASKLKDTGRVMSTLKRRHNGQMDFKRAKKLICERLH